MNAETICREAEVPFHKLPEGTTILSFGWGYVELYLGPHTSNLMLKNGEIVPGSWVDDQGHCVHRVPAGEDKWLTVKTTPEGLVVPHQGLIAGATLHSIFSAKERAIVCYQKQEHLDKGQVIPLYYAHGVDEGPASILGRMGEPHCFYLHSTGNIVHRFDRGLIVLLQSDSFGEITVLSDEFAGSSRFGGVLRNF